MLKRHKGKPMHGVELFRLRLIRGLIERGARVTIVVEKSWGERVERHLADLHSDEGNGSFEIIRVPNLGGTVVNGAIGAAMTFGSQFDIALMGDARRGLIPAMYALSAAQHAKRMLVFAHRPTTAQFADAAGALDFDTVCVSEYVARSFRGQTSGRIDVCYGVAGANRFYPRSNPKPAGETINFCLLGKLPNISKGHKRAIEAFNALPGDLRSRCHLHLASFANPPNDLGDNITAHGWMDADAVGEFLREMDVLLALSSNETFSQAIVQGMLTGIPSICTPLEVYTEKLDTGGGLTASSTREIVNAMHQLADDPALRRRMGDAGRAVALERYVWDTDAFIERFLILPVSS